MLKLSNFDRKRIDEYLDTKNYQSLAEDLKICFKLERDNGGKPQKYELVEDAVFSLHQIMKHAINGKDTETLLKELFRALRNYVINRHVQDFLITKTNILDDVKKILKDFRLYRNHLQIILQFLINLVIENSSSSQYVYSLLGNEIIDMLSNEICIYETSALMHNLCLYQSLEDFDLSFYKMIFKLYNKYDDVEFLYFFLENFIMTHKFWNNYTDFDSKHRILILEIIRHKQIKNNDLELNEFTIRTIITRFINSGSIIFQTIDTNKTDPEPYEISLLLEIISSLCGNEKYLKYLQNDKEFLINTGVLLINIHRLGKESLNYFTTVQKLSEIKEPNDLIRQHPAFGFKIGLIRIIGNLCWKNQLMQDLVREAELIPVILDCCNIDARNPFIMQWVILAVRNLCENNLKNQEIIAGLHQQGAVSSATLEEMGLTLHSDGNNSIKIIPLDALGK